jgi:hypothetical protein
VALTITYLVLAVIGYTVTYNVAKNKYRKKELINEYGAIIPWIFLYRSRLSHGRMIWLLAPLSVKPDDDRMLYP